MKKNPRIIFFGTPDFAVPSLERLVQSNYQVVAVVTAPDKPAGRGLKEKFSPVKISAQKMGLTVLQPVSFKDPVFFAQLSSYTPDLQIIIAFRMLPRNIWSLPPLGTFNLHASLLPQYRGAAPINHALMNGEEVSGLTTFMLNEKIDEGKILLLKKEPVGPLETAGELHDRLMQTGADLVLKTLEGIINRSLHEVSQEALLPDQIPLKAAPKIFREDCRINWNQDVMKVHNLIRGLSPVPGAFTEFRVQDGSLQVLKIYRSIPEKGESIHEPGTFLSDGQTFIKVAVKNGYIHVIALQLSGRKTMYTADFLRGAGHLFD